MPRASFERSRAIDATVPQDVLPGGAISCGTRFCLFSSVLAHVVIVVVASCGLVLCIACLSLR